MIKITDLSKCCGCTACQAVCPHDAISFKSDGLGFQYPEVDASICVECGLCESVCAFVQDLGKVEPVPVDSSVTVAAARHRNEEILSQSQSGGAFSALAECVLNDGGVVYGSAFDDNHLVRYARVVSMEGLGALRGSKYVQSDITGIFTMVKTDLKNGLKVMFTGTPCHVAGLKSYIPGSLQKNLFLVDFVCHGVPSPAIWKDYLSYMSRHGEIVKANFRDKHIGGWKNHSETFVYSNGKKKAADSFRGLFYKNIMLRQSCAVCPYNVLNHKSDVTIADFWGVDEILPDMDGDAGTSMVICNNEKGQRMLDNTSATLETASAVLTYDFMRRRNPNLIGPARIYKDRNEFEAGYVSRGFLYVARRWGDLGLRYRLWQLKKFILRK